MGLKVVFLGGGSWRILPIVRAAMAHRKVFDGGEIRLVDIVKPRAEAVGRMMMRTPEYQRVACRIRWGMQLDRALEGADVLYLTMPVGSPRLARVGAPCVRRGFITSDQISITGSLASVKAGPMILDFARRMEKRCPRATMLIFCNPVAVYSGMVNNHTRIRALGLCGGFANHRWDLTRLMGSDEYRDEYDVDVAGVNHLSFILKGTYRGRDLYKVIGPYLEEGWKPPKFTKANSGAAPHIRFALRKLVDMYHRFGKIIFSTEFDGMGHLYYEDALRRYARPGRRRSEAQIHRDVMRGRAKRREQDRRYREFLSADLDAEFWSRPRHENPWFARDDRHIAVVVLKALAGLGRQKIVTSHVNGDAVAGFKKRTVLEYSQFLDARSLRPAGRFEVPDCFQGLISSLATHQTLMGDAVATLDPRILAEALFAYPVKQNTRESRQLYREVLKLASGDIPAPLRRATDYV